MSKFTDEQQNAIDAKGRTIVSASAGSGKTTVMIEKMIRLICDEGVDVTKILAVTYTKKAAASMKDKLRKALVKAINHPSTSQGEQERLKAQYRQVPLADISTIHSFCAKLIRTHFYATDVGNRFGIIADDDADGLALKSRAVENVFEQAYADGDEDFKKLLSVFFRKKKDDTLRSVIVQTHSKVRTHVGYRQELEGSGQDTDQVFDAVCQEAFDWYVKKCRFYREQLSALYRVFEDFGRADLCKHCEALMDVLNGWIDAGDLFALAQLPWGKMPSKPKVDPMKDPPKVLAAYRQMERLQDKIKKRMNDTERKVVSTREEERKNFSLAAGLARPLAKFVLRFDDEYMRLKKLRGVLDYNDLEHFALALLGREEISLEMQEKYEYVFVDEYQDVNPVQERIVNGVSGKNLFLVGDIKQSIYGFRGSKSKFFAEKWAEFAADPTANALKLSKNFRSVSPVLDAVNEQFTRIMTKENSEVDYKEDGVMLFGELYEPGKGRVQVHFVGKDDEEEEEHVWGVYSVRENTSFRKAKLSKMAKKIREIIERERMSEYYDVETGTYKRVQYSDIAVLDRWKKGSIAEVIAALAAEGVPVSSESPVNICDFPEIKLLIDLLRLIDNQQQDIPLASVLLSPIGGLTEDDLVAVRLSERAAEDCQKAGSEDGGKEFGQEKRANFRTACKRYVQAHTDETAQKLQAFFSYFKKLRRFAQVADAGEVLTRVIAEKQMEIGLLAGVNGENCLKRIHRFIEETRNPEPLDTHAFLARLKMLDDTIKYCENGGENAVRVMTMHASKGLEFPVVIASNLSRAFREGERDEVWYVDGYGLAPKAYDTEKMTYASTVLRLLHKRNEELENVRDELNVYYVALTRAQYALHMLFDEESEGADVCYGKSYEDITDFSLWEKYKTEGAGVEIPPVERQALAIEADETLVKEIQRAQAWSYAHPGCEDMPAKTSPTALMKLADAQNTSKAAAFFENFDDETTQAAERAARGTDTLVGSAYHAFLEHFDFFRLDGLQGDPLALKTCVKEALAEMRAVAALTEEYLSVLDADKLTEILGNPVFYRLRDVRLYKEQRFMAALPAREVLSALGERGGTDCPACDEEMLLQGAIDLLAVGDGFAEILDYKYSQKGEDALRETYAMQLKLYKMAVAKALNLPVGSVRCTIVNIYRGFEMEL